MYTYNVDKLKCDGDALEFVGLNDSQTGFGTHVSGASCDYHVIIVSSYSSCEHITRYNRIV